MRSEREPPPYDELDDGIRETVRMLYEAGFDPTDSGDGSKGAWQECAFNVPNVFMRCDGKSLVAECDRLQDVLVRLGIAVDVQGPEGDSTPCIQGSYCPVSGIGIISLMGVSDALLKPA